MDYAKIAFGQPEHCYRLDEKPLLTDVPGQPCP